MANNTSFLQVCIDCIELGLSPTTRTVVSNIFNNSSAGFLNDLVRYGVEIARVGSNGTGTTENTGYYSLIGSGLCLQIRYVAVAIEKHSRVLSGDLSQLFSRGYLKTLTL